MKLEIRIALRYLFWRGSFNFISIISYVSLLGIIIGVGALIIVMSIFNGFSEFAEQQLIALDPHLKITAKSGVWIEESDSLINAIKKIQEVAIASPIISGKVVAMNKTNMNAFIINGVKQSEINNISGIPNSIIKGHFNIAYHLGCPGLVIGSGLQRRLDIGLNDTVELISPAMLESSIKSVKKKSGKVFVITGIFQTNSKDYDDILAFSSLNSAQELFDLLQNRISSIDIRLKNIEDVGRVKEYLEKIIPFNCIIQSWFDLHKDLYKIMQYERYAAFIVLSLVIIIALFNLLASLSMIVVTKQADIALLKSLGVTNKKVKSIFRRLGLIIGSFGTLLGIFLAFFGYTVYQIPDITKHYIITSNPFINLIYFLLMNAISQILELLSLDTNKYLLSRIPMSLYILDVIAVATVTIIVSYLATIYPSLRASKTRISQSIRNE